MIACELFTARPSIQDTSETGHVKPIRWRRHFMDRSFGVRGKKLLLPVPPRSLQRERESAEEKRERKRAREREREREREAVGGCFRSSQKPEPKSSSGSFGESGREAGRFL